MSAFDCVLKEYFIQLAAAFILFYFLILILPKLIQFYLNYMCHEYNRCLAVHRDEIIATIPDEEHIKILELMCLNSANSLDCYPKHSENHFLTKVKSSASDQLNHERCKSAEFDPKMSHLKYFDNEEFDYVVGVTALARSCDQKLLLKEIFRVIKPDGKYLFVESEEQKSFEYFIMKRLHSMLSSFFEWDVKQLGVDVETELTLAGFSILEYRKIEIQSSLTTILSTRDHVIGTACKKE